MSFLFISAYDQRMALARPTESGQFGHAKRRPAATAIEPLVGMLRRELRRARIPLPGPEPASMAAFTLWYLETVQLLEAHCAAGTDHTGMARRDVELMCRAALSGRDLRQAVAICIAFTQMLAPRAGRLEVVAQRDLATLHLDSLRANPGPASSLVDITGLFAFHQLFQWLAGTRLQLLQVQIGPLEREDVLPFLKLFNAPVLAGGDHYTLAYNLEVLDLPVIRTAAEFNHFFRVFPCGIFQDTQQPLGDQVLSLMSASLRQGHGVPTQVQLASAMGLPLSTFRRRLSATGTSFRALRETSLDESARHALEQTEMPIAELASRLGYSDAATFRRAFRQWHGMAPGRWREIHHRESQ